MKPIRGPIDYAGYPPRRKPNSSAKANASKSDVVNSANHAEAARIDEERAETERAARLHDRAQQFRQATHDPHGFQTPPHVVLLPEPKRSASANRAQPLQRQEDEFDRIERQSQLRRERLQARTEQQAALRDRTRPAWKRVRRYTWITAGILGAQCLALALTQPEMQIRSVQIEGAHLVSPAVLERVQAKFIGQNWLRARTSDSQKLLKSLPVVENVRIGRVAAWPPQMAVLVTERTPFARVGSKTTWLIADKNGVPFRAARPNDSNLEAVYDATWQPKIGQHLPVEQWTRARHFVQLLTQSRAAGNAWKLRRVYFDPHGFASLRLTGGFHDETLVQLGGEEWPQKLTRAQQSLSYLQSGGRRAAVLNLITYSMPVWTPRAPVLQAKNAESKNENLG